MWLLWTKPVGLHGGRPAGREKAVASTQLQTRPSHWSPPLSPYGQHLDHVLTLIPPLVLSEKIPADSQIRGTEHQSCLFAFTFDSSAHPGNMFLHYFTFKIWCISWCNIAAEPDQPVIFSCLSGLFFPRSFTCWGLALGFTPLPIRDECWHVWRSHLSECIIHVYRFCIFHPL